MKIKFIAGPPGTGKTHDFIKGKYLELYKKYGYENIVVLSHTNVAADQIRKAIANLKIVKENSVTEKKLEDKICTIHHYCNNKLIKKGVFGYEDHINLIKLNSKFSINKVLPSDDLNKKHEFYKFLNDAHGHGFIHNLKSFFFSRGSKKLFSSYNFDSILELKEIYDNYLKETPMRDFINMIQEFIDKAAVPQIDALIVDEAQDTNKPQMNAIYKMATNIKDENFYMVGDPDQTIFEFAGSDPDFFHRLSKNAEELKEGKRCGETINTFCKTIIKPIWDYYGYQRTWTPAVYTEEHLKQNKIENGFKVGDVIKGKHFYLPSLNKTSSALDYLLDKIKNTNQTFLFTYRQTPGDVRVRDFFKDNGIEFGHIRKDAYVSKKELKCHYFWPKFMKGEPMSLTQIKAFWDYMGSLAIVRGKSKSMEPFKDWINEDYTVDYLIKNNYLNVDVKKYDRFDQVRTKTDEERLIYINKVIMKHSNFDEETRVKYGNIHEIKGLTFDNVIVDDSLYQDENFFVQLRLKYTAYSRGIFDCWTLASKTKKNLGYRNGSI